MNKTLKKELSRFYKDNGWTIDKEFDAVISFDFLSPDDVEKLAQHIYNFALSEVKKEVEKRVKEKKWALKESKCPEMENSSIVAQTVAQRTSLLSVKDFIDSITIQS